MRLSAGLLLCLLALAPPALAAGRPMTADDLLAVKAVGDPQVSPDGTLVAYVVTERDPATDKSNSDLWLVPVKGGEPRRLTTAPGVDTHPRWSPDGKQLAFLSNRSGKGQVWLLPLDGGEARQLTKLPIDVAGPIWSPKGDRMAFAAEVYPGKSPDETAAADKARAEAKSQARVYDKLMVRHWDKWDEGKRSHIFVADAKTGEAKDLTPKLDANAPPAPFGGSTDYAISPDGKELAFVAEPLKDLAWSTNTDIWTVSLDGGEPKNLTEANKAADAQPAYSPDGRFLAYLKQGRPGFESDRWTMAIQTLAPQPAPDFAPFNAVDLPVLSLDWVDTKGQEARLIGTVDFKGTEPIADFIAKVGKLPDGNRENDFATNGMSGINTAPRVLPGGGVVFVHSDAARPAEIYFAKASGNSVGTALTHHNDALLAQLDLAKAEPFTFKGADSDEVSGWLIKPPGFDPKKKYPVVFLIHGGPQGAWHDEWHARWNYQLVASPGYAVVAVNPRGSTGYGQKFTDQISQDWTGRVYVDLMKGLDHVLAAYPFLDGTRVAAMGGSYGGFMVNWIAGHTDRFKALISHAGVFDTPSKYGTTEELWFPEWEFGGTPWDHPELYRAQSPSAFVQNFKTPTLVIHGALDFRVPDAQGLGMFTALQRRGVPSRYLFFPDEGHWILKPRNRLVWWREVHGWLAKYLAPAAP